MIDLFHSFDNLENREPQAPGYLARTRKKSFIYVLLFPVIILFYIYIWMVNARNSKKNIKCALIGEKYINYVERDDVIFVTCSIFSYFKSEIYKKSNVVFLDLEPLNLLISLGLHKRHSLYLSYIRFFTGKYEFEKFTFFTDIQPIYKMFVNYANCQEIKTICIQHGLFTQFEGSSKYQSCGNYIDYLYVFDETQKKVCLHRGIESRHICISGFPSYYKLPLKENKKCNSLKKICILGSGWHASNKGDVSRDINNKCLKIIYANMGIKADYKPHPLEIFNNNIEVASDFLGETFSGTLEEAFNEYDILIGIASTSLLQASINGLVAIQVLPETSDRDTINFEAAGYSYTISRDKLEMELMSAINNVPLSIETSSYSDAF